MEDHATPALREDRISLKDRLRTRSRSRARTLVVDDFENDDDLEDESRLEEFRNDRRFDSVEE